MMIKLLPLILIPTMLLSGCSAGSSKSVELSSLPTLEITATHAIALDQSADGLSFVPNNVAPWLGRIILVNEDSSVSSTDIEGRLNEPISDQGHSVSIGLARENASGVFLTIDNKNNGLNAFIESDDKGNFAPLSYSGNTLNPKSFCTSDDTQQDSLSLLTSDGSITTLSLSIANGENAVSAPVEQKVVSTIPAPNDAVLCTVSGSQTFVYSRAEDEARLHTYTDGDWVRANVPTSISDIVPLNFEASPYLLVLDTDSLYLFNVDSQKFEYNIVVTSGLSIGGLEKTKFITSTTHNFGGAAFSDGLVAFGQADEDRIVFVSRSYLADVIGNQAGK